MRERLIPFFIILFLLENCSNKSDIGNNLSSDDTSSITKKKLIPDNDNGGLILPSGFGAIVVSEGVGASRHIAVNTNGDIYIKLRNSFR